MDGEADLARHAHGLGDSDAALKVHASIGLDGGDPVEVLEEIEVPEGAAELAVGDRLQADLLLPLDESADLPVLHLLERAVRDFAAAMFLARVLEKLRAQEAADHVGAERRLCALHGVSP